MSELSELLYKLNKYQTLLNTDTNNINKDMYQKKILSYTNKINMLEQTGGAIPKPVQDAITKLSGEIKNLNATELTTHYNELRIQHKNILDLLNQIKAKHDGSKATVTHEAENAQLKEENAKLKAEIAQLQAEKTSHIGDATKIKTLESQIAQYKTDSAGNKIAFATLRKARDDARAAVAAKDAEHEALKQTLAEKELAFKKAFDAKDAELQNNYFYKNARLIEEFLKVIHDSLPNTTKWNESQNSNTLVRVIQNKLKITDTEINKANRDFLSKMAYNALIELFQSPLPKRIDDSQKKSDYTPQTPIVYTQTANALANTEKSIKR
jgi:hypothetical protein